MIRERRFSLAAAAARMGLEAGWLRPRGVLMAVAAIATGALACRDTTTPREVSDPGITKPSFTAVDGFTSTLVGRGHLGTFDIQCRAHDGQRESHDNTDKKSPADGYCAQLKSHDNTDIAVANIVVTPGGHSGWHYHPGPVLVVVKTGTITFYMEDDHSCSKQVHRAGTTFIEKGGMVGIARNEGTVEATVVATFFVPAGSPTRIDAKAPGNCPF
jgi:quercetin dioxygenase-like cupin family protein